MNRSCITLLLTTLLPICFTILVGNGISAAQRVSLDELNHGGWERYKGQTITLTTPLHVVGLYYDSVVLAKDFLYAPEEHAIGLDQGDSTLYKQLRQKNYHQRIRLEAKYYPWKIRTGAIVKNLTATVNGERRLVSGKAPRFTHTRFRRRPPKRDKEADMIICAANIQNYFYHLGGYASRKTTPKQFDLQTHKIATALHRIDADLYALCEVERGSAAPDALVEAMNRKAGKELYAWIDNGFTDADMIMVAWIYRKDRVHPYGNTYYAYSDTIGHYHYRLMMHGFEHIKSGEKLNVCLNHLRSKHGKPEVSNARRMANVDSVLYMLDTLQRRGHLLDEDILMVGDYNCYAYEQPIRAIVSAGYADQLLRLDPHGYSYVYHSERGYLDRVFANPSMEKQVHSIQPWHINTDAYYSKGYRSKYADTDVIRYADHDPVLIGIKF